PWQDRALHLQWAVPHLLALQRQPVLHASAVHWGAGVRALCGASGAGKTTLAHVFAGEGARLISEDLLPLTFEQGAPAVFVDGEATLRGWVASQRAILETGARVTCDAGGLAAALQGPTLPLHELLFVDAARRSGDRIVIEPIAPADALLLLLRNGFAELE